MKNNKGFTLIEMLAIILVIGIIFMVAGPSMKEQLNNKSESEQKLLKEKIENASKIYASKYHVDKLIDTSSTFTFSLNDLEKDGLVDLEGKCGDERALDSKKVTVKHDASGKIIYDIPLCN